MLMLHNMIGLHNNSKYLDTAVLYAIAGFSYRTPVVSKVVSVVTRDSWELRRLDRMKRGTRRKVARITTCVLSSACVPRCRLSVVTNPGSQTQTWTFRNVTFCFYVPRSW
jgi:hypothetical protein